MTRSARASVSDRQNGATIPARSCLPKCRSMREAAHKSRHRKGWQELLTSSAAKERNIAEKDLTSMSATVTKAGVYRSKPWRKQRLR